MAISQPSIGDAACSSLDQSYLSYVEFCQHRAIPPATFAVWVRMRHGYGPPLSSRADQERYRRAQQLEIGQRRAQALAALDLS